MDNQNFVIMLLLDLSVACDTVDLNVMLHSLSHEQGVVQNALHWFKSHLSDSVQSVHIRGKVPKNVQLGFSSSKKKCFILTNYVLYSLCTYTEAYVT